MNDYADQYWDVAEAYMGKRMFTSALEVFSALEASSKVSHGSGCNGPFVQYGLR